jgi:hypothetical protein
MSKNGLHRHYDKLTAEERFRLDVLAMARGDLKESERLVGSCPKFNYDMNDRAFTGRWLGALDMTLRIYVEIARHLDRMETIGAMRVLLPYQDRYARERMRDAFVEGPRSGAGQAWRAADGEGPAPDWPLEGIDEAEVDRLAELGSSILPEILDGLESKEAAHDLTVWRGFGAFCDETLALDPLKVRRVVQEAGAWRVEELEALAGRLNLEPDADTVEQVREGLREAWLSVEGRHEGAPRAPRAHRARDEDGVRDRRARGRHPVQVAARRRSLRRGFRPRVRAVDARRPRPGAPVRGGAQDGDEPRGAHGRARDGPGELGGRGHDNPREDRAPRAPRNLERGRYGVLVRSLRGRRESFSRARSPHRRVRCNDASERRGRATRWRDPKTG